MVGNLHNILMIFGHKRKNYNFDPFNVFLAIDTNIPVRFMTGFMVQGHKCIWDKDKIK